MKTIKWQFFNMVLWVVLVVGVGLLFDVRGWLATSIVGVVAMLVSVPITVFFMWLDYKR